MVYGSLQWLWQVSFGFVHYCCQSLTLSFGKPPSPLTALLLLQKKRVHLPCEIVEFSRMLDLVLMFFFFSKYSWFQDVCRFLHLYPKLPNVNCFRWLWKVTVCFSAYQNIIRKYLFQTRFQYTWLTGPHYLCKYSFWWISCRALAWTGNTLCWNK